MSGTKQVPAHGQRLGVHPRGRGGGALRRDRPPRSANIHVRGHDCAGYLPRSVREMTLGSEYQVRINRVVERVRGSKRRPRRFRLGLPRRGVRARPVLVRPRPKQW